MYKQVIIYDTKGRKDIKVFLNGTVKVLESSKFYNKYKNNSEYCCVKLDHRGRKDDPEKVKNDFIKHAIELKEASEGKINMFYTPDFTVASMKLFLEMNYGNVKDLEDFQYDDNLDEAKLIDDTTRGALMYCQKNFSGKVYQYDFISFYPSILRHRLFYVPIKPPVVRTIDKKEFESSKDALKYGIYKVKISGFDCRVFRENEHNLYTHFDINFAKRQNYNIQLIEEENNFYDYSKSLMRSDLIFKDFVDYMYKLKEDGYKYAKALLNCLWGYLCEKEKKKHYINNDDEIEIDGKLLMVLPCDEDDSCIFEVSKSHRVEFKTNYARMKPFLLSKGRMRLGEIAVKNIENLVYMHTDCIVLKKVIDDSNKKNVKSEIGYLKIKKGIISINNITDYEFEEI